MAAGCDTEPKLLGDTLVALESARKLTVTDENGHVVDFGSFFKDTKAIIIFIRVSLSMALATFSLLYTYARLTKISRI